MGILKIDTTDVGDLLTKKSFDPIPNGVYTLEIENNLVLKPSKSSDSSVVAIELRVIDDGEFKGRKIFDNLVIGTTVEARKKGDWKIAQFAVATGLYTKETLNEIELDLFKGATLKAKIGTKANTYQGNTEQKNFVKEYLFEA
jgi:hypothetical protein